MMAISATALRLDISQGCAPDELLPPSVWEYVRQRGLYLT
jgi:nicotinic acid mononucleotide adenylyltransferase